MEKSVFSLYKNPFIFRHTAEMYWEKLVRAFLFFNKKILRRLLDFVMQKKQVL